MLQTNLKVQPLVGLTELPQAVQNVRRSASDGTTKGFILACISDEGIGFSFLARTIKFSAALHYSPRDQQQIFELDIFPNEDRSDIPFVEKYLQTAARNMGADYEELVRYLAWRKSDWRFVPWEYGKPGRSQDNDSIWRTHLWPLVLRTVTAPPHCMETLSPDTRATVLQLLRAHATEGSIVL